MKADLGKIQEMAKDTGFLPETVEKVVRLAQLLSEIHAHPYLNGKLVLKGGTAIHLFWLEGKRLSVDIDLNYVGAVERKEMLAQRPKVEEALQRLYASLGYEIRRIPSEHAGGKWQLKYRGIFGQPQILETDINYLYRVPIWGTEERPLHCPGFPDLECRFPIVHRNELWAGKIVAALMRTEPRDLFDLTFIPGSLLKSKDLRRTLLLIGSGSRTDWRKLSPGEFESIPSTRLQERLFPVIRTKETIDWSRLARKAASNVKTFYRLTRKEQLYFDLVEDKGEYRPEILFPEPKLCQRLGRHPLLLWKVENRRTHLKRTRKGV